MRARAAELYADGKRAPEVAAALGITERRAKSLKLDVGPAIREGAASTIEAIAKGAADVRERVAARAADLAEVLVSIATGQLEAGLTKQEREQIDATGADRPLERDAQVLNARARAAIGALGFIVGQKLDVTAKPVSPETAAQVVAIVRARTKA